MPALAARPPSSTRLITTPRVSLRPSSRATAGVTGSTATPSLPFSLASLATVWSLRHEARQSLRAGHLVAVELRDDVAGLDPRLHGRGVIGDAPDERSHRLGQAEALGELGRERLDRHTQPASRHVAGVGELGHHRLRQIARDGKADADRATRLAEDRRVDADGLAARVDERPAAV